MLFSYQKNDFLAVLDDIFFKIIYGKIDLFWIMALHFTKHNTWPLKIFTVFPDQYYFAMWHTK